MDTGYSGRQIVGIDQHRRRSVIARMTEDGAPLRTVRNDNDPFTLAELMTQWGEAPLVVLEAMYGCVRHEGARPRAV